jgi:hypothetical protein
MYGMVTVNQRRAALLAFMEANPSIKKAQWERASELSEGTIRGFLKRAATMTDETYEKLAAGASKLLGRMVRASELRGDIDEDRSHPSPRWPRYSQPQFTLRKDMSPEARAAREQFVAEYNAAEIASTFYRNNPDQLAKFLLDLISDLPPGTPVVASYWQVLQHIQNTASERKARGEVSEPGRNRRR